MPIRSVHLNVTDLDRSVDFYTRYLDLQLLERTEREAVLDAVTATLRLALITDPEESTFIADDLQAGFRHVGFKVADLASRVAVLKDAGVPFQLDPLHAEGDVEITFFLDPDGTLLEFVEGPLQYHEVYDRNAVQQDWDLGTPGRPRFDHVAETVEDLARTRAYFADLGFRHMAGIHQPHDTRGYEIDFLRSGDVSLEVFTYSKADTTSRQPQLRAPGFVAVTFVGDRPASATAVGVIGGDEALRDPDGLVHLVSAP